MKIGIISDTHGKLHPPVLELIASCDVVLHVGRGVRVGHFGRVGGEGGVGLEGEVVAGQVAGAEGEGGGEVGLGLG